ncbi:MAG: phosphoserine phosphatase SerB [Bdellovibrionales bacterium GWB1_52_6]|nr:MAG: phosphoserine phosphatase SerB [Bdellovibrionales bacterium GWB1_52_6]
MTLFAERVSTEALQRVRIFLESHSVQILSERRLHEHEFQRVELIVQDTHPANDQPLRVRVDLLEFSTQLKVDIALQKESLYRRTKRILVMDIDATLIQNEVINELARERGVFQEVSEITRDAMEGNIDFSESLKRRCAKLKGLTRADLDRVYSRLAFTPGALELISTAKRLGFKTALISGGFSFVSDRLKTQLGLDYAFANSLETAEGVLTGNIIPPIINAQRKADLLEQIALRENASAEDAVAIGDGANDALMLERAGLGIAFNAKPALRRTAHLALHQPSLRAVLYLLTHSPEELSQALRRP